MKLALFCLLGFGVFAIRNFAQGDFLLEYRGNYCMASQIDFLCKLYSSENIKFLNLKHSVTWVKIKSSHWSRSAIFPARPRSLFLVFGHIVSVKSQF